MRTMSDALRAYSTSAASRGYREQEADLFMRVNHALRRAREQGGQTRVKALADAAREAGLVF